MSEWKSGLASYTYAELWELCEKNPELFDELADDAIRLACTGRTPEQTAELKRLQWTIDAQLRKGKTPLRRLQLMESVFYGKVFGEEGSLSQIKSGWTEIIGITERALRPRRDHARLHLVKK